MRFRRSVLARTSVRPLLAVVAVPFLLATACRSSGPTSTGSNEVRSNASAAPPRTQGSGGTAGSNKGEPSGGPSTTGGPTSTSGSGNRDRQLTARIRLIKVGEASQPVAMANRPGSPVLYIAEQAGRVRTLRVSSDGSSGSLDDDPLLDITSDVDGDGERGLLGLAFSANGSTMFAYYTDKNGRIHVVSYRMDGDRLDEGSRTELLSLEHEMPNHNGGQLATGPDGMLYIGVGDGGGAGDPEGHAQDRDSLYGKILRIDPARPSNGKRYGIPDGNPFAEGGGAPEVWIYGARNPWRFSFDRSTGDLWVGDVGQNEIEEIDFLPNVPGEGAGRGANLGWVNMEGTRPFRDGSPPSNHTPPVFEFDHNNGECSVISGFVYRGREIPSLVGVLPYGDYCYEPIRGLLADGGNIIAEASLGTNLAQLTSFGQDNDGEQYALSQSGGVYRIAGA